jgi:plastocyanin
MARGAWLCLWLALAPCLAQAAGFIVNVGGAQNAFSPQTITITAGDTVTFVNKGGFHNVVADDNSFRCARGCDGQPNGNGNPSNSNWVASVTFNSPGTIGYFCEVHGMPGAGMFGTIAVQPATPVRLQSFFVD